MVTFFEEEKEPQKQSTTPSFSEVLNRAAKANASEMKVSMPAEIIEYDYKTQKATVKPYFKRKYNDGNSQEHPLIYNVPVAHPRAGGSFIHVPIKKGHVVQLVFADRSLEKWLSNGSVSDPDDSRMHDVSDAIAYLGGYPFSNTASVSNGDDIIIKNGNSEMRIKENGHLQYLNSSNELIKVIEEWMNASIAGSHNWKIRIREKLRTFLEK